MLKAAIFDFDGLILDTEVPEFQSWCEVYESHGQALDFEVWSRGIGTRDGFDPYALLDELVGRTLDRETIRAVRRPRNLELVQALKAMDGVEDRLIEARELGLKLGVASSSDDDWVYGHLDRLALRHYFDTIVCAGTTSPAKPHPAVYLSVVEKLGVDASEAVAFEDSPNGIAGAKAAGLLCIAVPNAITARLNLSAADDIVPSLTQILLADLAETWESQSR